MWRIFVCVGAALFSSSISLNAGPSETSSTFVFEVRPIGSNDRGGGPQYQAGRAAYQIRYRAGVSAGVAFGACRVSAHHHERRSERCRPLLAPEVPASKGGGWTFDQLATVTANLFGTLSTFVNLMSRRSKEVEERYPGRIQNQMRPDWRSGRTRICRLFSFRDWPAKEEQSRCCCCCRTSLPPRC